MAVISLWLVLTVGSVWCVAVKNDGAQSRPGVSPGWGQTQCANTLRPAAYFSTYKVLWMECERCAVHLLTGQNWHQPSCNQWRPNSNTRLRNNSSIYFKSHFCLTDESKSMLNPSAPHGPCWGYWLVCAGSDFQRRRKDNRPLQLQCYKRCDKTAIKVM